MNDLLMTILLFIVLSPGLFINLPGISNGFWSFDWNGTNNFFTHQTSFLSILVQGIMFVVLYFIFKCTCEKFEVVCSHRGPVKFCLEKGERTLAEQKCFNEYPSWGLEFPKCVNESPLNQRNESLLTEKFTDSSPKLNCVYDQIFKHSPNFDQYVDKCLNPYNTINEKFKVVIPFEECIKDNTPNTDEFDECMAKY